MTQEIITYSIGAIIAIVIIRWAYQTVTNSRKGNCTTCDGCKQQEKCDKKIKNEELN